MLSVIIVFLVVIEEEWNRRWTDWCPVVERIEIFASLVNEQLATHRHTHTRMRRDTLDPEFAPLHFLSLSWTLFHSEKRKKNKKERNYETIQVTRYWYHLLFIYLFIHSFVYLINCPLICTNIDKDKPLHFLFNYYLLIFLIRAFNNLFDIENK